MQNPSCPCNHAESDMMGRLRVIADSAVFLITMYFAAGCQLTLQVWGGLLAREFRARAGEQQWCRRSPHTASFASGPPL